MNGNKRSFRFYRESPLYHLLVSLLTIIVIGGSLAFILILAGRIIFGSDITVLDKSVSEFNSNDTGFLRYLLIIQDISLFIVPSIIILRLMKPEHVTGFSELEMPKMKEIALVIILAFCMIPVTSFTGQINSSMHFPDWLSGVEHWITEKEDKADNLIEIFLASVTISGMIFNLITIALFPAVAEELLFRGVFQKIFHRLFRSGHLGIWLTAFLFSAIHFQFFGFIPRFLLGLVFGYIYYWSGILLLPVIMHFINNAYPVIIEYIQGIDKLNAPPDTSLLKQAVALPLPIVIGMFILLYFRNKFQGQDSIPAITEDKN